MTVDRPQAIEAAYGAIARLRGQLDGGRRLVDATGASGWPHEGVYLLFEPGEVREDRITPRVVHVGAPEAGATTRTALWQRLSQHRGQVAGTNPGGGDHRGSQLRRQVGAALIRRDHWPDAANDWGRGASAPPSVRAREVDLEVAVSEVIRHMPLLWLEVTDAADRDAIRRDLVALLSNADRDPIDPPSDRWLGHHADEPAIRASGLWNVEHVTDVPDGAGLSRFADLIDASAA